MYVLGIETSTPVCSVGLVDDDRVLASFSQNTGLRHAERTMAMADRAMADAGVEFGGPGWRGRGFGTGFVYGPAYRHGRGEGPVPRVGPAAFGRADTEGAGGAGCLEGMPVCAMLDARRGNIYAGVYSLDGGCLVARYPDAATPLEELIPKLPEPVLIVGEGGVTYGDRIQAYMGKDARFARRPPIPAAHRSRFWGVESLRAGNAVDATTAEPEYHRLSQAESAGTAHSGAVPAATGRPNSMRDKATSDCTLCEMDAGHLDAVLEIEREGFATRGTEGTLKTR